MNQTNFGPSILPHHKLIAFQLAFELAQLIGKTRIGDAKLREQARKSAASAALNISEGAAKRSRAEKSRVYDIALAEACEAAAAGQIHGPLWACSAGDARATPAVAGRVAK